MNLIGLQYDIQWHDKVANQKTILRLAESAAPDPGDLIVLPEMAFTGFSMDVSKVAETEVGESSHFMSQLALRYRCRVLGGLVEQDSDGMGANMAVLVGPDGNELLRYRKIHPFSFGGENQHYRPGSRPETIALDDVLFTPVICYDLRFPEIFRWSVRRGAGVFAVIADWPRARQEHWTALLRARAIENQAYVIGVNRIGSDPFTGYDGGSLILDPKGRILSEAQKDEAILKATVDIAELARYRDKFPAIRDMRPPFPES